MEKYYASEVRESDSRYVYLATEVDAHLAELRKEHVEFVAALQTLHEDALAEKDREIQRLSRPLIRAEDAEMIKWFAAGCNWSLEGGTQVILIRCPEINTGPRAINDMAVTDVPQWVSSRVAIGETITVQNIDGGLHWYIEGMEVFNAEPASPPTAPDSPPPPRR